MTYPASQQRFSGVGVVRGKWCCWGAWGLGVACGAGGSGGAAAVPPVPTAAREGAAGVVPRGC